MAHGEGAVEGLADLEGHVALDEIQRMAAVIGADIELRLREFLLRQGDDAVGGGAVGGADQDGAGTAGAGGAQHVEAGAVAVIDLEAEAGGGADHLHIGLDGGDGEAACQQGLAGHLAEAAEADDQRVAMQGFGTLDALHRGRGAVRPSLRQQHGERGERHGDDDGGGEHGAGAGIDQPGAAGGGVEDEGELAALGEHGGAAHGLPRSGAEEAGDEEDHGGLGQHQHHHAGQDQQPVAAQHAEVEAHADAHEEEAEQDAAEGLDVCFELVAEGGFREQHAGQEGAHGHGKAAELHGQRGAEDDEQGGGGHHLPRPGTGEQGEHRVEQPAAGGDQGGEREQGEADGDPVRAFRLVPRGEDRDQGQERHDRQVLQQQDGDDALPGGGGDLALLLQHLHGDGGGGQDEAHGGDEGHGRGEAGEPEDGGEHGPAGDHLGDAEAEDLPPQAP